MRKPELIRIHCGCKYIIKKGVAHYTLCKWHKEYPVSVGGVPVVAKN
jgi:hypothetical protein